MTRDALLLRLLKDAGTRGVTTAEIMRAGVGERFGARLHELREAGHTIHSEHVRQGSWRYTLVDAPSPEPREAWSVPFTLDSAEGPMACRLVVMESQAAERAA